MRPLLVGVAAGALLFAASAGGAVKAWWWTPGQAGTQLVAWNPAVLIADTDTQPATVTSAKCVGAGTVNQARYLRFRCAVTFRPSSVRLDPTVRTVFVKVRAQAAGQPCVSMAGFASVPTGCLVAAGARAKGSWAEARLAVRRETGTLAPVACTGHGAGFYRCSWDAGRATVVFRPAGPTVTVLDPA